MDAALIEREKIVALLFSVGDVARSLRSIALLLEETIAKRQPTQ